MKGYKALDKDMRAINGNNMQYEMNKLYSIKGKVVPEKNGFHFCKALEYLNIYYDVENSRIFEIEASGKIVHGDRKYAAEKIRIVQELTKEAVDEYFKCNLENLIKNGDWQVRKNIAQLGYGLEQLINDKDWTVRREVAQQGYGLDVLINDENYNVRNTAQRMMERAG